MSFEINDQLNIDGIEYSISEHPNAPGVPYGQEGRKAVVYQIVDSNGGKLALKVFKPRFRVPYMVTVADRLAPYASLPGLQVCQRTVLTASRHETLLSELPELIYAVLMPWIEGATWQEIVLSAQPLSPENSLKFARSLAQILVKMEERGLAHCDLSGPNLIISPNDQVVLVDLEEMYGPGFLRPEAVPSGSPGYGHRSVGIGLWGANADRFAGALLLAEMLGWYDERVINAAWGDSYFAAVDLQNNCQRFDILQKVLAERWGKKVADLFTRVWKSDTLNDCPTFAEWLIALPRQAPETHQPLDIDAIPAQATSEDFRELVALARKIQSQGDMKAAVDIYEQALSLLPEQSEVATEIQLVIREIKPVKAIEIENEEIRNDQVPVKERSHFKTLFRTQWKKGIMGVSALIIFSLLFWLVFDLVIPKMELDNGIAQLTQTALGNIKVESTTNAKLTDLAQSTAQAEITIQAMNQTAVSEKTDVAQRTQNGLLTATEVVQVDTPSKTYLPTATINPTPIGGGGGLIAYLQNDGNKSDLYTINDDGSELTRLTNTSFGISDFTWSFEGDKIVFIAQEKISYLAGDIYTIKYDGTGLAKIAGDVNYNYMSPIWIDHTESFIACKYSPLNYQSHAVIIDINGFTETPLDLDCVDDVSPDGLEVVFSKDLKGVYNLEIFISNIDGSNLQRITNDSNWDYGAKFSPDGDKIAFQSRSKQTGLMDIFIFNIRSGTFVQLTDDPYLNQVMDWLPDSRSLAFIEYDNNHHQYIVEQILGEDGLNFKSDEWLYFSPDGKLKAYQCDNKVCISTMDDTVLVEIPNGSGIQWQPGQ